MMPVLLQSCYQCSWCDLNMVIVLYQCFPQLLIFENVVLFWFDFGIAQNAVFIVFSSLDIAGCLLSCKAWLSLLICWNETYGLKGCFIPHKEIRQHSMNKAPLPHVNFPPMLLPWRQPLVVVLLWLCNSGPGAPRWFWHCGYSHWRPEGNVQGRDVDPRPPPGMVRLGEERIQDRGLSLHFNNIMFAF